jgi:hypothetical protein
MTNLQPTTADSRTPATISMPVADIVMAARDYVGAGRYEAAERLLGRLRAALPRHAEALHLSGVIAFRRKRFAEAAALMEQAAAAGGVVPRQLCALSEVYRRLGRLDDGIATVRRAQALDASHPLAHFNEALLRYERMEPQACIRAARRAIALNPELAGPHYKLAQALLLTGDYVQGWEEYEWRFRIDGAKPFMPRTKVPQWRGQMLAPGERLLLVGDQGFGDIIMFSRFLPWAFAHCRDVVVAVGAALRPLLKRHFPQAQYIDDWPQCPPFAAWCAFSGLPRLAGVRAESVPAAEGYLQALPERVERWRDRLASLTPPTFKRVAIVWAGRPEHNNDHMRSIALDALAPLGRIDGVTLVSLQFGTASAAAAEWTGVSELHSLGAALADFEDTAGVLANVDLLICVDTAVAHLCGALGRPAWLLLPYAPDWRWGLQGDSSPWYASIRLVRQRSHLNWTLPVAEVANCLSSFVAHGSPARNSTAGSRGVDDARGWRGNAASDERGSPPML